MKDKKELRQFKGKKLLDETPAFDYLWPKKEELGEIRNCERWEKRYYKFIYC